MIDSPSHHLNSCLKLNVDDNKDVVILMIYLICLLCYLFFPKYITELLSKNKIT